MSLTTALSTIQCTSIVGSTQPHSTIAWLRRGGRNLGRCGGCNLAELSADQVSEYTNCEAHFAETLIYLSGVIADPDFL